MELKKTDTLPPLIIEYPDGMYGESGRFVQDGRISLEMAERAFNLCRDAISTQTATITNMYPAHIGGKERFDLLMSLAKQYDVSITHLKSDGGYGIIG